MILFIANTRNTLFNIINFMLNVNDGEPADLILSDHTPGLHKYYDNLVQTGIFNKIFLVETFNFHKKIRIKDEDKYILLNPNESINKILNINMKLYHKFFMCDYSLFDKLLFEANYNMEVFLIEEGAGSFTNDQILAASRNQITYNFHNIYDRIVAIYSYNPQLISYDFDFETRKLPKLNRKNEHQVDIFNNVFNFKFIDKLPKYIFVEQCFRLHKLTCNDIEFIEELSKIVGSKNLYVKFHPKTIIDNSINIKSTIIKEYENIPFELLILNYDLKNHVLITVHSSSAISASTVFNQDLNIVYLYDAVKGSCLRLGAPKYFKKFTTKFLNLELTNNTKVPLSLNNYKKIIKQFNGELPKDYVNKIQVVYFAEDLDTKNLSISITSLLVKIDIFDFFDIYIFSNEDIFKENKELILSLKNDFTECDITFITSKKQQFNNDFLNRVENIGLFLANELPQVNRCIYLTSNVIAGLDFFELYDDVVDVEKVYVAGVVNPNLIDNNQLEIKIDISVIDTSILIYNLYLIREDNSNNKLNFEDSFKQLDIKYNISTENFRDERLLKNNGKIVVNPTLAKVFTIEEINYGIINYVVINFNGEDKPWENIFSSFSEIWWGYYYSSPYRKQIIDKVLKPKVSIILPICDVEGCLNECLDTLTNQTLKEIEIICINDGSTDNTFEILNEYAKYDKRITIIEQEQLGFGIARNKSLEIISGEYALFFNANVCLDFDMLEHTFEVAESKDVDILVCGHRLYNDFNGKFEDIYITRVNNNELNSYLDTPNGIFNNFGEHLWNKLIKVNLIKDNNVKFEELQIYDNLYFNNILLILAKKIMIYNEFKIIYRTQLTEFKLPKLEQYPLDYYNSEIVLMNKLKEIGVYETVKKGFLNKLLSTIITNLNSVKQVDCIELMYNKIKNDLDNDFEIAQNSSNYYSQGLYQSYSMIKNNDVNAYLKYRGFILKE